MPELLQALHRTLLLMRDDLSDAPSDLDLLAALTGTRVALVADFRNLASHSAQSAFVTSALLLARSAHTVYLLADDIPLVGQQPPLDAGGTVSALVKAGHDLLPGIQFSVAAPQLTIDLQVLFGDSSPRLEARRTISISADAWSAQFRSAPLPRWPIEPWPLGGLAAAGHVAVEAFKIAMRRLRTHAINPRYFDAVFADAFLQSWVLAPPISPRPSDLGHFDVISAGAIANNALFVLGRVPQVEGRASVWDDDVGDSTNLNRNALLLRSRIHERKVDALASVNLAQLALQAVPERYSSASRTQLGPRVLVGVDHIPSRWDAQQSSPDWLGIGATTHWACMASFHVPGLGCARCLHPHDDPEQTVIPTVAFVSYWAGLLLAAYFLRSSGGEPMNLKAQQVYFSPLRPESPFWMPVPIRMRCPLAHQQLTATA